MGLSECITRNMLGLHDQALPGPAKHRTKPNSKSTRRQDSKSIEPPHHAETDHARKTQLGKQSSASLPKREQTPQIFYSESTEREKPRNRVTPGSAKTVADRQAEYARMFAARRQLADGRPQSPFPSARVQLNEEQKVFRPHTAAKGPRESPIY